MPLSPNDLATLTNRVRLEIGDTPRTFLQELVGDGTSQRFRLSHAPISAASTLVLVGGLDVSDACSVEETSGVLLMDEMSPPAEGARIVVSGTRWRFFTDTELCQVLNEAVALHMDGMLTPYGGSMTMTKLPEADHVPVVLLASIQALYVLLNDATFDIDVMAPDGVSIPRSERYRQILETINLLQERYRELSAMTGTGLYGVSIYNLRRVSKRTNRLVPLYVEQEFDDRNPPERVRLPISRYGVEPAPSLATQQEFVIDQGSTFNATVTVLGPDGLPIDLTGYSALMQIRRYIGAPVAVISLDGPPGLELTSLGEVKIHLSDEQTDLLRFENAKYDITVTDPEGCTVRVLQGTIIVSRSVSEKR